VIPQNLSLLSNVNANATGNPLQWQGGLAAFEVQGTLGGGSVSLQVLGADGQTWTAFSTQTTVTAVGIVQPVYLPAGPVRAVLTGAAGASGVYAALTAISN
jgi:hypothetical protein